MPHCGQLIADWHNEWYETAQRRAIYGGLAAMDCPLCRRAVLWVESRAITIPANDLTPVYQRSILLAARWVPIREATCVNLTGYLANHPAGQQYGAYWAPSEVQQADQEVTKP